MEALLSTAEAAALLKLKPGTLRKWRTRGTGPNFIRYGSNRGPAYYRRKDIAEFVERHRRWSTSEETAPALREAADTSQGNVVELHTHEVGSVGTD